MTAAGIHKRTILVVDDDADVRSVIARVLRAEGYAVIEAQTPLEAIAECAKARTEIDLLLTEYNMPGTNGAEVSAILQRDHPLLHVLFMAGSFEEQLSAWDFVCLPKPLNFREMVVTIRKMLDDDHRLY